MMRLAGRIKPEWNVHRPQRSAPPSKNESDILDANKVEGDAVIIDDFN
jgi:hypothetical protein